MDPAVWAIVLLVLLAVAFGSAWFNADPMDDPLPPPILLEPDVPDEQEALLPLPPGAVIYGASARIPVERELCTIMVKKRRLDRRDPRRTLYVLRRWADRRVARERVHRRVLVRPIEMAWSDSIADDWLMNRARFLITFTWADWPRAAPLPAPGWSVQPGDDHIELALEVRP